jgi:hypothetical protein
MGLGQMQNGGMGFFTFNLMLRELIEKFKGWACIALLFAFSIYVWAKLIATLILK